MVTKYHQRFGYDYNLPQENVPCNAYLTVHIDYFKQLEKQPVESSDISFYQSLFNILMEGITNEDFRCYEYLFR